MIVIPMAGLSRRFKEAGFKLPKYMLKAFDKTLFEHSVESFRNFFLTESFLFIGLNNPGVEQFIKSKCIKLGIFRHTIILLNSPTNGQAETVYLGLKKAKTKLDEPIIIFNIDTFRPNFSLPKEFNVYDIDGYLECFIGSGSNWSNVLPYIDSNNKVQYVAEKQQISKYCCTGIYYWRSCNDFLKVFDKYRNLGKSNMPNSELYIAPMYNFLILEGCDIRFKVINHSDVIFCGTPKEYYDFLKIKK